MKILIFLLLFLNFSFAFDSSSNISLNDFAKKVSFNENVNIFIDEDINATKYSYHLPNINQNTNLFNLFEKSIRKNGYILKKIGNIYYLHKLKIYEHTYIYNLKYNSFDDCKQLLDTQNVKYTYLSNLNSFVIHASKYKYRNIKSLLEDIDIKKKQVILKLLIFEYTDSDIKELGINTEATYVELSKGATMSLNTILSPLDTENQTLNPINFYSAIKFLNKNNIINFKQYPYILAKNNQEFKFEAVENIPYLEKTTKTESSNYSEQTSITYKDVGLKINGKTLIYDDYISLDLDLIIEDIISQYEDTNTPKTFKRHLQSKTNISYNKVLVLSGLKRNKVEKNHIYLPFINKIPIIGQFFDYEYENLSTVNITIAIQILEPTQNNQYKIQNSLISGETKNVTRRYDEERF